VGTIVWAIVRDHNDFRKRRPAIVLTARNEVPPKITRVIIARLRREKD
jgi:hypothetical protein